MSPAPNDDGPPAPLSERLLGLRADERRALAWSFLYFFCVLCSYYLLRPVRDEMAILGDTRNIRWLFLATFLVMLAAVPAFGWITSRFPRRRFLPWVYLFFAANIALFFVAFRLAGDAPAWVARSFFVWISVYNLFVVSVFWSFMADVYSREQARRLFGVIAAGGSAGAITGPFLTQLLVEDIGYRNLLPISAGFLLVAILCIHRLRRWSFEQRVEPHAAADEAPLGGRIWDGLWLVLRSPYLLAIGLMMVFATFVGTALYIFQAELFEATFAGSDRRTAVFARMDLAVNAIALTGQLVISRLAIRHLGVGATLALLPGLSVIGFVALALHPLVAVVIVFQVLRRGINYGLNRPAKEMLFTVLGREAKYKAKNFIDTFVFRAGDAAGAQLVYLLQAAGAGYAGIAAGCAAIAALWSAVALRLGRAYRGRYTLGAEAARAPAPAGERA